jgi:hypothetical protein
MTNATSSILIIAGAVMAFVTSYSTDAIYIQSASAIVMMIGALGLAASLLKPTRPLVHAHHDILAVPTARRAFKATQQDTPMSPRVHIGLQKAAIIRPLARLAWEKQLMS